MSQVGIRQTLNYSVLYVYLITMYQWKLCLYFIVWYTYTEWIGSHRCQSYSQCQDFYLSLSASLCHSQGYHSLCKGFLPVSQSMSLSQQGISFSLSRFHDCLSFHVSVTARDIILCVKVSYLFLSPCLCHSQGYHSLYQGFTFVSQSMSLSQPGISFSLSRFLTCLSVYVSVTARDIILCVKVSYLFLSPNCLCHSQGYHSLCQGFLPVSQSMSLSQPGISFSVSRCLTCLSVHVSVTARDIILCVKVPYLFLRHVSVTARDIILSIKVSRLSLSPCLCHSQGYISSIILI